MNRGEIILSYFDYIKTNDTLIYCSNHMFHIKINKWFIFNQSNKHATLLNYKAKYYKLLNKKNEIIGILTSKHYKYKYKHKNIVDNYTLLYYNNINFDPEQTNYIKYYYCKKKINAIQIYFSNICKYERSIKYYNMLKYIIYYKSNITIKYINHKIFIINKYELIYYCNYFTLI